MSEIGFCRDCRFSSPESAFKRCHRRPPSVFQVVTGMYATPTSPSFYNIGPAVASPIYGEITAWPLVSDLDFCGEFERKISP